MRRTIFNTPVFRELFWMWARLYCRLTGWKLLGEPPETPFVIIAMPHTKYNDFIPLMALIGSFRQSIYWAAKDSAFKGMLGPIARFLGGVPIDRSAARGQVEQLADFIKAHPGGALLIAPEGTRKRVEAVKSGFYHVAKAANVPIVFGQMDFKKRIGGYGGFILPTDDIMADFQVIYDAYKDYNANDPANWNPEAILEGGRRILERQQEDPAAQQPEPAEMRP